MPGPSPELLFVSGPQKGQRVVLLRDLMLGGRSELADISFTEEFISREQLQFQRIPEGWIVERLAGSNPVQINSKRYKSGKQILLATGDVIALGAETQILFVDGMDDPNQVLAEYRREHPDEPTPVEPPAPAEPQPVSVPPQPVEPPAPVKSAASEKKQAKPKPKKSSNKTRKYMIAFLVYLAILAIGVVVISKGKRGNDDVDDDAPELLTSETISRLLRGDLKRSPNEVSAQRSLKEARTYYRHRTSERRNLYRCLLAYRLFQAYRRPDERTFLPEDERKYNLVAEELTDKIWSMYSDAAYQYEGSGQWARAKEQFDLILQYIPVSLADEDPEVRDILIDNIMAHTRHVSRRRGK
ncbi:MAG: FHA domain-containing protein [Phycisphaerae bacterium]|nr:FHA domain-containing protein [Phycisphaerae bacterium]